TGWVANVEKGLIVTNDHVAGHAKRLRVFFPNLSGGEQANTREELIRSGKGVPAKLLLTDPKTDLAVIQVESLPHGTTAPKLADRSISPGDRIHAIGNPSIGPWVYSAGDVRLVHRKREGGLDAWVVESSLPVNPGDSGGPQVNDRGELVSVTSHRKLLHR